MGWGSILFSFYGRINRAKYWAGVLAWTVLFLVLITTVIVLFINDFMALQNASEGEILTYILGRGLAIFLIFVLVSIVGFVSGLALGVKRLHDRDKSGWWILVFYVLPEVLSGITQTSESSAVVGVGSLALIVLVIWAFIELGCLRGTPGPNRFGPDPLATAPR
jgi:uncharacterized membrane protein YhaH (DUF805 family)